MQGNDNEENPPRRRYRWTTDYKKVASRIRQWIKQDANQLRFAQAQRTYQQGQRKLRTLLSPDRPAGVRGMAVVALVAMGLAALCVAFAGSTAQPATRSTDFSAATLTGDRQREVASRSEHRTVVAPDSSVAAAPKAAKATEAAKAPARPAAPAKPNPDPGPVGGLTNTQWAYAKTIVSVGKQMGLPKQAYVVALATAMQESKLYNLANWNLADSMNVAHDGVGGDFDSVGLFQQRPSSGWGSVGELMNPAISAQRFYSALEQVGGWQGMPITVAAQTVQGSAFPDAYAAWEGLANQIANTLAP
jgi:hypothetical protein